MAGNHDIGFGWSIVPEAYERYKTVFGDPNFSLTIANHTFVCIDTLGFSGASESVYYQNADKFLNEFVADESNVFPRILLSHVPLYRPDNSPCGSIRNKPLIKQGSGYQYQNLIVEPLANHILSNIKPVLTLSGDDHDDCIFTHTLLADGVETEYPEHSIATFSWLQGNIFPGFALLSLNPDTQGIRDSSAHALRTCSLPPQLKIYNWYITLLLISVFGCFVMGLWRAFVTGKTVGETQRKKEDDAVDRSISVKFAASCALRGLANGCWLFGEVLIVLLNEIRLKETFEKYSKTPHKIRTREVFAVLDEIIPQLGVFGPLVTIIKDELFQSVFSKTLTSCEVEPFVERVPFFSIAGRVDEARHVTGLVSEEAEKANDSLAELQQRVRFRDHDLQILYKKNMALKQDITDYQLKQETLLSKIKALEDQCHKYELEKGESAYYYSAKEDSLKHEIEKLQVTKTTLAQKNAIIDKLTVFKTAYNDASSSALDEIEKNKTELIVDSIGMVEYDIYQAERLQEQFAEILNYQMDDFELALSQLRKKKEILVGVVINETERDASYMLEVSRIDSFGKLILAAARAGGRVP
ncbi:hypothetical protein HDU83_009635 [Entophlyctis luteolus]|nr:hypothetical protein HDU83_009635 [Entophlyctis luteolus]